MRRHPRRSPSFARLEQEQQRQREQQDRAAQDVDSRERQNARLRLDLPIEHEQRLLLRDDRIDAVRHEAVRDLIETGESSYLEQLDAQRGVLAADLALIQARTDELTALVALSQAMGGGWTPE